MESVRQRKMASLLKEAMSEIFMREGSSIYGNKVLVSIVDVKLTPDNSISRYYISIFNADNPEEILTKLNNSVPEIRGKFGKKLGKHLRIIPTIEFYMDDTMEYAQKMDQIFKNLKKD